MSTAAVSSVQVSLLWQLDDRLCPARSLSGSQDRQLYDLLVREGCISLTCGETISASIVSRHACACMFSFECWILRAQVSDLEARVLPTLRRKL